jgi:hypothetical protein
LPLYLCSSVSICGFPSELLPPSACGPRLCEPQRATSRGKTWGFDERIENAARCGSKTRDPQVDDTAREGACAPSAIESFQLHAEILSSRC